MKIIHLLANPDVFPLRKGSDQGSGDKPVGVLDRMKALGERVMAIV